MKYWVVEDDDDEEVEETKYSNILQEEEYEDDDPPEGFGGPQTGSNLIDEEKDYTGPVPWNPSENIFFVYI
jgi:hypothetical protein